MATGDTTVSVKFTSDTQNLTSGADKAADSVDKATKKMESDFLGLNKAVKALGTAFLAFEGVKILSNAFSSVLNDIAKFNVEVAQSAQVFGVTSAEISALALSLDDIGSSLDVYQGAYFKFVRQLNNNPDFVKSFGIDVTGKATDVFQRALNVVTQYKAGIDQTEVAMDLFGRTVADVINLQRLNNDVVEDGKRKAEEYGLAVTNNDIAASREWISAQNDLKDMLLAFEKVIAGVLQPAVIDLAKSMGESMPQALDALRLALAPIIALVDGMIWAFKTLSDVLGYLGASVLVTVTNGFNALGNAIRGNFSAAAQDIEKAGEMINHVWNQSLTDIGNNTEQTFNRIQKQTNIIANIAAKATGKPIKQTAEEIEANKPYVAASGTKTAPLKPDGKAESEAKKQRSIELQYQAEQSREEIQIATDTVERKKEILQTEVELGQKTRKQQLEQLQQFENDQYQIQVDSLQRKLQLAEQDPDFDVAKREKLLNDMLDLQRKHELEILKLKNDTMLEEQKYNIEAQKSINSSFEDTISGLVSGQKTLKESLMDFIDSITKALSKLAAQNIASQFGLGGDSGGAGGLGGLFTSIFGGGGGGGAGVPAYFGKGDFFSAIPSFDVGTNFVPNDTLAMVHKGEKIIPANQNARSSGGAVMVNMTVNTPDANSFRQSQAQIAANLQQTLNTAARRNK